MPIKTQIGIWWPEIISNQELWEKTGQSDINVEIKRRKYGWNTLYEKVKMKFATAL
jgi:hypothetical protein